MDTHKEVLIATFDDEKAADEARKTLKKWAKNHEMKMVNAAVLKKDEKGNTSVDQDQDVSASGGALFGAVVGGVLGFIGGPVGAAVGVAAGAATGGATAAVVNFGFSEDEIKAIKNSLPPNSSALITLIEARHTEALTRELNHHTVRVWHQTLSPDYEGVR